jgi:hypothetical protein
MIYLLHRAAMPYPPRVDKLVNDKPPILGQAAGPQLPLLALLAEAGISSAMAHRIADGVSLKACSAPM